MNANGLWYGLMDQKRLTPPKVLIIGAGSRGNTYAKEISQHTKAVVAAVAEPILFKRKTFGRRYIWKDGQSGPGQEFEDWRDFLAYEQDRRRRAAAKEKVEEGVDAVFVCTLDEQHAEIIIGLAQLRLHVLSEKPLATTLTDCLDIYSTLLPNGPESPPEALFGVGHVLRYSPHNMQLRKLVFYDNAIGDVLSIEHTEPVGWWHFAHSYVRGNWRKESTTAPSLLTKSCHDIDLLLWLLCSPPPSARHLPPHLPSKITSTGHLNYFRKARKPREAGTATNCLSCPIESFCIYSAKKIYVDRHLKQGKRDWPVKVVDPEIEDYFKSSGQVAAEEKLLNTLAEDYNAATTPASEIAAQPWFGRCVWESDNDVCDDQTVTITWADDPLPATPGSSGDGVCYNGFAKTATFHMIAQTEAQCARRGRIYGTTGEISYDSKRITVHEFASGRREIFHPPSASEHHGGGDGGLVMQFIGAVEAVKCHGEKIAEAQLRWIGCDIEEIFRSHAVVFAAEEARKQARVVDWKTWWTKNVEAYDLV